MNGRQNVKKLITTMCAVGLLAAPALADASSQRAQARQDAIKTCKSLRAKSGKKNFAQLFGAKNGYGKCVSKETSENVAEAKQAKEQALKNAAKECKAEQEESSNPETAQAYADAHGASGKSGNNAYGRCVSQHAKQNREELEAQDAQEDQNQVNAAKECKAERTQSSDPETAQAFADAHDGKTFGQYYGTNANGKNAFGKCVSKKAREKNDEEQQQ